MLNPDVEMGSTVAARPPDPDCVACSGTGRIRQSHRYLRKSRRKPKAVPDFGLVDPVEAAGEDDDTFIEDGETGELLEEVSYDDTFSEDDEESESEEIERLFFSAQRFDFAAAGWGIDPAAPEVPHRPGEPDPLGRPPTGIRHPERVGKKIGRLLREDDDLFERYVHAAFDFHDPNGQRKKRQLTDFRDIWSAAAKESDVNVDALSRVSGVKRRQINKRVKRGLEKGP
jgi:hypothetical protein